MACAAISSVRQSETLVNEDLTKVEYLQLLAFEIRPETLEATTVYTIRSPKSRLDGKPKHQYLEWANLPPLGVGDPD